MTCITYYEKYVYISLLSVIAMQPGTKTNRSKPNRSEPN